MQQVVVIHGGDAHSSYEEYISALKAREVSLEDLAKKGWKGRLPEVLGGEYTVIAPRMPNSLNAKYSEWKIWLEKYIPLLNLTPLFVGHSLGGVFLAKYLSEEQYPTSIKATMLVAAPFPTPADPYGDFNIENDLSLFKKQGGSIFLYHSTDDPVVPFASFAQYQEALPDAIKRHYTDRGHFLGEDFPEIISDIQSLP